MARGLNRIQIFGHLGRDPEMRYPPGGQPTTTFSVAVNRGRRGQDGQRTEETDWFRVVCWNKLTETVRAGRSRRRPPWPIRSMSSMICRSRGDVWLATITAISTLR